MYLCSAVVRVSVCNASWEQVVFVIETSDRAIRFVPGFLVHRVLGDRRVIVIWLLALLLGASYLG